GNGTRPRSGRGRATARVLRFSQRRGDAGDLFQGERADRDADGGRALDAVGFPGPDGPSRGRHARDGGRLLAHGDPDVESGSPVDGEVMTGEGIDEGAAAARV